jgi:predicted metal-binding protein
MLNQKMIDDVKNLGISAAAYFDVADSEFKFDVRFRELCENNTCGSYGRNYMCPPAIGTFEECAREVLNYKHALIIETIYPLEDSFDYEGMRDGGEVHSENVNKVWDYIKNNKDNMKYEKLKILGAGGCRVCPKCGMIDNVPCRFPEKAISSIEGHSVDVAHLTESHGLKYINGENTVTYVALYLLR